MKKKNIIITLATTMLMLQGCEKFLDVKPKGRDLATNFEHYKGLLNNGSGIEFSYERVSESGYRYSTLVDPVWQFFCDELIADEILTGNQRISQRNAFRWLDNIFEPDDACLEYGAFYKQLYTYNVICNGVMNVTDATHEEKLEVLSEARVGRAYAFMMLAQFWGKPYNEATAHSDLCVPLTLEASTSISSYTRATVKEIYDFFIKELEEAAPLVPEYTQHRRRIYRASAYAILGRAYMFVYNYEKARNAFAIAENLIENNSSITIELYDYHTVMPVWQADFTWPRGLALPDGISNTQIILQRDIMVPIAGLLSPRVYIKPEYIALYTEGDLRKEFFTTRNGIYSNYRMEYKLYHNEGVDYPAFLLMYAECLARTGNTTKARELVSKLRQHRFNPGFGEIPSNVVSQDDLTRFIVEERLREYMSTGHRWFDIRRLWNDPLFQDLKANYTHFDGTDTYTLTEDRLVMKFPQTVMNFNPGWDND